MRKILFEDAPLTSQAKVTIDGVDHLVTEAEYDGGTDLNASTFNELQDNVENEFNNITGKILWANPNPTSEMGEQSIELNTNIEEFDMYEIIYKMSNTSNKHLSSGRLPLVPIRLLSVHSGIITWRDCEIINTNTLRFSAGQQPNSQVVNAPIIPLYIIGYKTGLFS